MTFKQKVYSASLSVLITLPIFVLIFAGWFYYLITGKLNTWMDYPLCKPIQMAYDIVDWRNHKVKCYILGYELDF
jgi:hypothetical protein